MTKIGFTRPGPATHEFRKGQRVERITNGDTGTVVMVGSRVIAVRLDKSGETLPLRPAAFRVVPAYAAVQDERDEAISEAWSARGWQGL